jgi:peptide/nickel transport system permease protein
MNAVATADIEKIEPVHRRRESAWRSFLRRRPAVAGAAFLILMAAASVAAPILAPYQPNEQDLRNRLAPPDAVHWLGTDDFGRDVLSRLLHGGAVSLAAAAIAVVVALVIGLPLGLAAGWRGRGLDAALSRVFDGLMSVPALMLALTIVAVLGPGLLNAMTAVGLVLAPQFFRVSRAAAADVRQETFIEAARAIGCRTRRTVGRHLMPNVLPPVLVQVTVTLGVGVSAEASLSFLGLGVEPPTASWGGMLSTAAQTINVAPHLVWPPGIMIFLTVLAFSFAGQGVQSLVAGRTSAPAP